MTQINQYVDQIATLNPNDYIDVDAFIGVGVYESSKILWSAFLTTIENQISFKNIFNTDGQLTGVRNIDMNFNNFIFGGSPGTVLMPNLLVGPFSSSQPEFKIESNGTISSSVGLHAGTSTDDFFWNTCHFAVENQDNTAYLCSRATTLPSFFLDGVTIESRDPSTLGTTDMHLQGNQILCEANKIRLGGPTPQVGLTSNIILMGYRPQFVEATSNSAGAGSGTYLNVEDSLGNHRKIELLLP